MHVRLRALTFLTGLLLAVGNSGYADGPPPCQYGDEIAPGATGDAHLALVDTNWRLHADFAPVDLVSVRAAGLADDRMLREPVVEALAILLADAERAGVAFELQSAYRSYGYQQTVFEGWVNTLGRERALLTSARPGHSEHQLGTALDLRTAGGPAPWDLADWAQTREGAWLAENAWRYGFVMSYPRGAKEASCYDYEPWHYRWVGEDVAAQVREQDVTLREWLWKHWREAEH